MAQRRLVLNWMSAAIFFAALGVIVFSLSWPQFFEGTWADKAVKGGLAALGISIFVRLLCSLLRRTGEPHKGLISERYYALYVVIWPSLVSGVGFFCFGAIASLFLTGLGARQMLVAGTASLSIFLLLGIFRCVQFLRIAKPRGQL